MKQQRLERLAILSMAAPMAGQCVMLCVLLIMHQWMFAAMMVPSLIGCLATLTLSLPHSARNTTFSKAMRTQTDAAKVPATQATQFKQFEQFEQFDRLSLEHLMQLDEDLLPWRTVTRNWLQPPCLNVPIGMGAHGLIHLDLSKQGPHALVAGTTGSGKSVLLQSWCLALACRNPPERLQFVFLDFKGGSAFRPLERLPHCVGNVCDLDLKHAVRALHALESELRRREQLVANSQAQHIDAMPDAPPRLVVVIDEFHALRDQLPDLVSRIVRVASLGRSLGMHVIACTQHPVGQVSGEMKANMTLGLCLRVRDAMQSMEIIGSSEAANIPPSLPGTVYCNDGENIQAWRCAATRHISRLVDATIFAARCFGSVPSPALFSPPLPRLVRQLPPPTSDSGIPFALADNGVTLDVAQLPITHGNIGIIGQHGRGKTTLLTELAKRLAEQPNPIPVRWTSHETDGFHTRDIVGVYEPNNSSQRRIWLIDDADPLFDPFGTDPLCEQLRQALADHNVSVVFAVESSRHVRIPEHCAVRVVFPTSEQATDQMNGIPSDIWASFDANDMTLPGRAVLIDHARATPIQCAYGHSS